MQAEISQEIQIEPVSHYVERNNDLESRDISEMHENLKKIGDSQQLIITLLLEKSPNRGTRQVSEDLWKNSGNAWDSSSEELNAPQDDTFGEQFLKILVPWGKSIVSDRDHSSLTANFSEQSNFERASKVFRSWVIESQKYHSFPWSDCLSSDPKELRRQITANDAITGWPYAWQAEKDWRNERSTKLIYIIRGPSVDDPFCHDLYWKNRWKFHATDKAAIESSLSGIILNVSTEGSPGFVDYKTVATIICFAQGSTMGTPKFLSNHMSAWREPSIHERCDMKHFYFPSTGMRVREQGLPGQFTFGVFALHMRSFIAAKDQPCLKGAGLQCQRESVHLKGFYNDEKVRFIEKRYSIALLILPLQRPCGRFGLISLADDLSENERSSLWYGDQSTDFSAHSRAYTWKRYGILPAGLYTGISVFQLQICCFIDLWENDWNQTIAKIDNLVLIKYQDLENDDELRKLVLQKDSTASVLYFKTLKLLGLFIDSVRTAPEYINSLSSNAKTQFAPDIWFEKTYPHTKSSQDVISYNWDIVINRQTESSERILIKLERTKNEVKSLMDGLFNVQSILAAQESIDEAQKSRELNKYMLVFTVVTIAFLPPTFVATFFSNSLFSSPSDSPTDAKIRIQFWVVFISLTIATYTIATLMLFGTNNEGKNLLKQKMGIWRRIEFTAKGTATKAEGSSFANEMDERPTSSEDQVERGERPRRKI